MANQINVVTLAIPGPPGSIAATVTATSALSTTPDYGGTSVAWPSGVGITVAPTSGVPRKFLLDRETPWTADNLTVFDTQSGVGKWVLASRYTGLVPAAEVGIDTTGATDAGPAMTTAAAACVAAGCVLLLTGTIKIASQVVLPPNLIVQQHPGATIVAAMASTGTPAGGSMFLAKGPTQASSTTVASANTVGKNTISLAAAPTAGQWIFPNSATNTFQQELYQVTKVTGSGPYTVQVDRPILYQFTTSDPVGIYNSVNSDIRWYGNGGKITGTCVRYFEFVQAWDCIVENVNFDVSQGAPGDMVGSFDVGSYRCLWRKCNADGMQASGTPATLLTCAYAHESSEAGGFEDCTATNWNGWGYLFDDVMGGWALNSRASNCSYGLTVNADGNTIGSQSAKIVGGNYDGNTADGITVVNGSSYTSIVGATANYNAGYGISVTTGSQNTRIANVEARGNGNSGISVQSGSTGSQIANADVSGSGGTANAAFTATADCTVDGLTIIDAVGTSGQNRVLVTAGNVTIRGLNLDNNQNTALNVVYITGGVVGVSGKCLVGHSSNAISVGGGVAKVSDLVVGPASTSSGEIGLYCAGGTLRIGPGVDAGACATPLSVTAGGHCNRKQTVVASAGGTSLAWPDAKSTDVLLFNGHQSAIPTYTITPGTGFTVTDSAGLTWEYFVP